MLRKNVYQIFVYFSPNGRRLENKSEIQFGCFRDFSEYFTTTMQLNTGGKEYY